MNNHESEPNFIVEAGIIIGAVIVFGTIVLLICRLAVGE